MARFHQGNKGSRGNDPGTGLSGLAAQDHQRDLAERAKLRHTPVEVSGVWYLGTDTMPHKLRSQFLKGVYSYRVDRRLS